MIARERQISILCHILIVILLFVSTCVFNIFLTSWCSLSKVNTLKDKAVYILVFFLSS